MRGVRVWPGFDASMGTDDGNRTRVISLEDWGCLRSSGIGIVPMPLCAEGWLELLLLSICCKADRKLRCGGAVWREQSQIPEAMHPMPWTLARRMQGHASCRGVTNRKLCIDDLSLVIIGWLTFYCSQVEFRYLFGSFCFSWLVILVDTWYSLVWECIRLFSG